MPKFEKGNDFGKRSSRRGVENKMTRERKDKINEVLKLADELLPSAIEELAPKDLVSLWLGLQEYVLPKLARTTLEGGDNSEVITIKFEKKQKDD